MHRTFSEVLNNHISGSTDYKNTQTHVCLAVNEYFVGILSEAMTNGKFMVSGAITTAAAGATSPVIGIIGTVSGYVFQPITRQRLYVLFKIHGFYLGLCKAIEEMLNRSIIEFDIKSIGALIPMPGKIKLNAELFADWLEMHVHSQKAKSKSKWFDLMNNEFENIWKFVMPQVIAYSAPVPGGVFNGTILIDGTYI